MADARPLAAIPHAASEEQLRRSIELMFFAYRDFTGEADAMLQDAGFGRAHHRAIYFIGRHPRITVGGLLRILKITKQSLSRVLRELIDGGYVDQETGARDRRQRLLSLTASGAALEKELTQRQQTRFARAFGEAGAPAMDGFHRVLLGMIDPEERPDIERRLTQAR
ncbi:MAG: MarR family transcriptional regulator [Rhodospirillales bacterium]|nr:MAG: MarR family transcriptional regulator [Rhodospirillales bacterium]